MNDFERIFSGLEHHGPGTDADSLWALDKISPRALKALDIGCGAGRSTLLLARHGVAHVTGLDNLSQSLMQLQQRATEQGVSDQVATCEASMTAIPFAPGSFELLWSEGSAYIMGFEQALKQWRPLLCDQGHLVISELVWIDKPQSGELVDFWHTAYPDMQSASSRLLQCQEQGYQLVDSRLLGAEAWLAYTRPLAQRLEQLAPEMPGSQAIADLRHELTILEQFSGRFSYMLMVLKKSAD